MLKRAHSSVSVGPNGCARQALPFRRASVYHVVVAELTRIDIALRSCDPENDAVTFFSDS